MKRRKHMRALAAHTHTITLAVDGILNADGLPTEFRLFKAGWNETENGKYLFDAVAAQSVIKAFAAWGVDLMIDLDHQSINTPDGAPDPTARDARGWCRLELRNGELWACDVKWTPDGAARLTNKTQRYVSPAFQADPKSKRVMKIVNVAITAMPATHDTPALVAASKMESSMAMGYDVVQKALDALEAGDAEAATEILKHMIASAAGGEPEGDKPGSEGDGAEGIPPRKTAEEKVEDPKVVESTEMAPESEKGEEDEYEKPEKKAERKALHVLLKRLTGKANLAEAVTEVETFRASHFTLETQMKAVANERAVLESAERRKLVAELVKCGAEFPSTVWADDKATTIKPRWAKMPIAELRAHVTEQKAARGMAEKKPGIQPATTTSSDPLIAQLTPQQLKICEQTNCDPKDFARLQAFRDSKKG